VDPPPGWATRYGETRVVGTPYGVNVPSTLYKCWQCHLQLSKQCDLFLSDSWARKAQLNHKSKNISFIPDSPFLIDKYPLKVKDRCYGWEWDLCINSMSCKYVIKCHSDQYNLNFHIRLVHVIEKGNFRKRYLSISLFLYLSIMYVYYVCMYACVDL